MIGLDITLKALLSTESIETIKDLNESGKMLHSLITHYGDGGAEGVPMHDVNTIFYLLHPEAIQTKDLWVDVVTEGPANGTTIADVRGAYHDGKTNVAVSYDIDTPAFNKFMIDSIAAMPR